jgi:predicted Zn-dependent peptidase
MCFKGSRTFPSWSAVTDPFSQSGANFNATTTKQYTCFIIDCLDSHVHQFLRILGDMMLRSKFNREEYKLELNVVREEMKMRSPDSFIERMAFSGSAYANWVDHESFHKPECLPYNAVVDYYHQYYVPQNIVLSIVSSISLDTIIRHVSATPFAEQMPRPAKTLPITNSTLGALENHCESYYMFRPSDSKTSRIEIGVRICDQFKNDEFHALNILRHVVSASMSSRLFVELREKRGLTYRSGAYMNLYETAGVFVLYAISDAERLVKDGKSSHPGVIPVMFSILEDLIKNGVKDAELKRAKQSIKESLKMDAIAGGDKSSYNGVRVMLHNDTEVLANKDVYDKCYKSVTKSNVNEVIAKYFGSKRYYFLVMGGNLPKSSVLTDFLTPPLKPVTR